MTLRFRSTVVVFTLTLFTSAALLFFVELMIGKMILPKFGGTPAVWNTCMVFFQSVLLAGYAYAHAATDKLNPRRQTLIQLVLLALPFALFLLPVRIDDSWAPKSDDYPAFAVLWLLTITVGMPFFVMSTSAPLLSKWFASTGDPGAKDPYFLYAASNVGSMIGLFAYPLVIEPALGLWWQSTVWAVCYCALIGLTAWCASRVWRATVLVPELVPGGLADGESAEGDEEEVDESSGVAVKKKKKRKRRKGGKDDDREAITQTPADRVTPPADVLEAAAPDLVAGTRPTLWRYLYWIALAFVPSSLMLAVTTYLTTDIASMPLLWVLPLGLYLLSFILVFSKFDGLLDPVFRAFDLRDSGVTHALQPGFFGSLAWRIRRFGLHQTMVLTLPVVVLLLVFLMVSDIRVGWIGWAFLLHLSALFVVSMVCHGELARTRPATEYLTGFYLCMSFGGVIGGMFNALAAPLIFASVAEYPLVLVAACLLMPPFDNPTNNKMNQYIDLGLAGALGLGAVYAILKFFTVEEFALPTEVTLLGGSDMAFAACLALGAGLALAYPLLSKTDRMARWLDVGLPLALAVLSTQLFFHSPFGSWTDILNSLSNAFGITSGRMLTVLTYGLPVALCYGFAERPVRFGLGVGAIFLAGALTSSLLNVDTMKTHQYFVFTGEPKEGKLPVDKIDMPLHQERSFFGVLKVENRVYTEKFQKGHGKDREWDLRVGNYVRLLHGTTLHGEQRRNSTLAQIEAALAPLGTADSIGFAAMAFTAQQDLFDRRNEALTYYHRTGPIGQVYESLCPRGTPCSVAFIGLGTGTMASYVEPGQHADIYEIDAAVVRIAEDPKYFTYLRDCRGKYDIKLGDARLKMRESKDYKYRLIVVDAFSSDAIPVHLITKEAIQLYFDNLAPGGIVALHISNRHLRLGPVLGTIAADLGKACMREYDDTEDSPGKNTSDWVIMTDKPADFGDLRKDPRWKTLEAKPGAAPWTDDYSNIISVLRWWE